MSFCSNFTTQIPGDSSLILEKLRWESGPASIPSPEDVLPILQRTQRELEDCQNQIRILELRRESLQNYIDQLQALLSPFRKVPDEILQRILDDCCDVNHFTVRDPAGRSRVKRHMPALALTSVCSRWRRNGLEMPGIWSRILLAYEAKGQNDQDTSFLFTLDIFLNRSLQHPLTVTIDLAKGFCPQTKKGSQHPGLTLLINHTHRWRSFTYRSDSFRASLPLLLSNQDPALKPPHFPLLEDLNMEGLDEEDLEIIARNAPNLNNLCIPIIPNGPSHPAATPLFLQLLHLEFHHPYSYEIQTLIDYRHRLVSLKTDESVQGRLSATEASATVCDTIDTLTLCHDPISRKHSILLYLTLPSLKAIHLERDVYLEQKNYKPPIRQSEWGNFDIFVAFLSRSSPPLTTLYIESLALIDLKLLDLLARIPTLLDLRIDDNHVIPEYSPITGRFIDSLQVCDANTILPKLHSLKLNVGVSTFNDASVVNMIRSRWTPSNIHGLGQTEDQVDCLREFTIIFRNREEIPHVYQALEDMEKNGLRAVVRWKSGGSESEG